MRRSVLFVLLAMLLAGLMPASAFAAAPAAPKAAPVVGIDVQLWPEEIPGSTVLIVVGKIATAAPLPATVTLPVPEGADLTWVGEIFSNSSKQDIQREPKVSADKRTVTVTVEKSRLLQYEANYKPVADRGGRRYATLDWRQASPAEAEQFSVKLPIGVSEVKTDPKFAGEPQINQQGDRLYILPDQKLATGAAFRMSVDYVPRTAKTTAQQKRPDLLLPILGGLLAIVVIVLIIVLLGQRHAAR